MSFVERMMKRWNVGPWGVLAIASAFALAGMTVVRIKRPILRFVMPADAPGWLGWLIYLLVIVPLYQICLLGYGSLLGQRRFFWQKLKNVGRLVGRPFAGRPH